MAMHALAEAMIDTTSWLEDGLRLHGQGDLGGAEALFRRAAAADRDDPTAPYLLGLTLFEAGDAAGAVEALETAVALRPDHAQARLTLANLRHWTGDYAAAAIDYRRVIDLDAGRAEAWSGLGQALLAAGLAAPALDAAERAVDLAPDLVPALLAKASALAALARAAEAADAYRGLLRVAPTATAYASLALVLLQAGEIEAAIGAAGQATQEDVRSPEAWFALGAASGAAGRTTDAAAALERSLALDPDRAAAHLNLGAAYVELDAFEKAEANLMKALALDPASAETLSNLSSLCCRQDRAEEAEAYARRALDLDPDLTAAHQNLAGMLARRGEHDEARRHLDRAYGVTNLFIVAAVRPLQRVLILTTTESGNIPQRYLLPADRYTRLSWFIEYARASQIANLPDYDVVFNAIGDPDLAGPTDRNMERFLAVCDRPFFNKPDRVARTCRHMIPALLGDIDGVIVPAVARIDAGALAERGLLKAAADAGVVSPMLVRPMGSHGGQGLTLLQPDAGPGDTEAATAPGQACYVTAFHDFRSPDGFYRKYRIIFVDRRPYPYHLGISDHWMVHYETSGTSAHPERLAEERRFLDNPAAALGPRAMAAIEQIGRRMDLDFCGADFTLTEDGEVLVFEANATMLVHPEAPDGPLAHKNPVVERIYAAFGAMLAGASPAACNF